MRADQADFCLLSMTYKALLAAGALLTFAGAAVSPVYDETAWTRQQHSFKLPFPAQLLLPKGPKENGFGLNSQTGPYDVAAYRRAAEGETGRSEEQNSLLYDSRGNGRDAALHHGLEVAGRLLADLLLL